MEKRRFFKGAVNHLSRGERLFNEAVTSPEKLFYCALELRFGIESRLREYLEYQEHVAEKKKNGWQIAALGRDVEAAFAGTAQEVRIEVWSGGFPMIRCAYTPVTQELRSIGEKLGNYLHAPKSDSFQAEEDWQKLESLLRTGLNLLKYATSGSLLGVPLMQGGTRRAGIKMSIEEDQRALLDELLTREHELQFNVSHVDPPSFS